MNELLPLARELDEYTVTPGVLGFVVFAVLGVGVWILLKSMSKHLGKISIPEDPADAAPAGDSKRDGRDGQVPAPGTPSSARASSTSASA
jgi:hypothetical protein